jgi:succinyl-CoA synthetase beta subunit
LEATGKGTGASVKLFEYQAKDLFEEAGIAVPKRKLIKDLSELDGAMESVGLPCVVKAQVLRGGRGKAGLIRFASTAGEARTNSEQILGSPANVGSLLVEQALDIEREIYLSITADPVSGSALIMASAEGGVEIEEVARTMPGKIIRETVDLSEGLLPFQARNVMYGLGLGGEAVKQGSAMLVNLYDLFRKYDAELVEINPLALDGNGDLIAADGKVTIDDSSLHRQKRFVLSREYFESDVEYQAAEEGIPYLKFDGDIGLMCAGAGLTNVIYDLVNYGGGSVASYIEFGGPNYRKAVKAMELMMKTEPKVVLVVTFGTIARADVIAEGLADAIEQLGPEFPVVTAIRGTGEEKTRELLRGVGLEPLDDTEEAVERAIELAGGRRR